jgi:polysaccharide biosynthesis/export protein
MILTLTLISACAEQNVISADSDFLSSHNADKIIKEYRVGIDDVIDINVWRNPELSVSVPVRPDGKISMPLIGDLTAAGLTPEDVAKSIKQRLKSFIRDPNVTVIIKELRSHEYLTLVRVTGAVNNPLSLNFRQGMTTLDAVLAAGGLNDYASPNKTKLYRVINGKTHIIYIHLDDILNKGLLETNIELRPRDIIAVPERIF